MLRNIKTKYGQMYYYKNDKFIGASLEYYGEYTGLEIDYIKSYIQDNDIIIDIGANIGTHTLAYSSLVPNGQVLSFEPNQKNYNVLVKNVKQNSLDNVHVFLSGLSDYVGLDKITDYDPAEPGNYGTMKLDSTGTQVCFVNKLDNVCNFNKPVKFVKMDVEGLEPNIIMGGCNFIAHHKPLIQYECMSKNTAKAVEEIFTNYFPKYNLYWMPIFNYNQNNYRNNPTNIFVNSGVVNILAVHSSYDQPDNLQPYTSWNDNIEVRSEGMRLSQDQEIGG